MAIIRFLEKRSGKLSIPTINFKNSKFLGKKNIVSSILPETLNCLHSHLFHVAMKVQLHHDT